MIPINKTYGYKRQASFPRSNVSETMGSLRPMSGGSVGTGHYALWLMPSGTACAQLAQTHQELTHELSAPFFDPHVTLLGGIRGETAKIVSQCEQLADSLRPFEIQPTEPGHLDDYYRRLFLRIAPAPVLIQANAR